MKRFRKGSIVAGLVVALFFSLIGWTDGTAAGAEEISLADTVATAAPTPQPRGIWDLDVLLTNEWYINDIEAIGAWAKLAAEAKKPGDGIVVAVLDTGVDITHTDLANNIWVNTSEKNGVAGVDDDGNGYIDDINGLNLPAPGTPMTDTDGQGTELAGLIGMEAGNGLGIGVAYSSKIMPVRLAATASFSKAALEEGIRYAANNGADIICISAFSKETDAQLESIVREASQKCILVAAAGNEMADASVPYYPAAYDCVTGVTATDASGKIASFSNIDSLPGAGYDYEIAAPGAMVMTTVPGGQFANASGTAHAAAITSGAMAVALARMLSPGYRVDPSAFKKWFVSSMKHKTTADPSRNNLSFTKLNLMDAVSSNVAIPLSPQTSVAPTVNPVVSAAPVTTASTAPTAAPAASSSPVSPSATVLPVSPTAAPGESASPTATKTPKPTATPDPEDVPGGLFNKGDRLKAGTDVEKAIYKVKNPKKRIVIYFRSMVKNKSKEAAIPESIILADGKKYAVAGVDKKAFIKRKKVDTVTVFSRSITRKMMSRVMKNSNIKWVFYK